MIDTARPVFWHEGLFLRPQHFQRQELYYQHKLQKMTELQTPFGWGVVSVSIRNIRLQSCIFEVESTELVFQDGSIVNYPDDSILEPRSFENAWAPASSSLSVYVGLRHLDVKGCNLSENAKTKGEGKVGKYKNKRFLIDQSGVSTLDLFSSDNHDEIAFLKYDLQLFFGEEAECASNYYLIKIAEICRVGNDLKLSADYIPPVLNIENSVVLKKIIVSLNDRIRIKQAELIRWYKDSRRAGFAAEENGVFMMPMLQALSRYIPLFQIYTQNGNVKPFLLYQSMLQLIGELSIYSEKTDFPVALSNEQNITEKTGYVHKDIRGSIGWAVNAIDSLLEELSLRPDHAEVMHYDGTYYSATLGSSVFARDKRYYVAVKSDMSPDILMSLIESNAKISSREVLPLLLARSLTGVNLTFVSSPPAVLQRYANTSYYLLDSGVEAWKAVEENSNIALYFERAPADLSVELLIVGGD